MIRPKHRRDGVLQITLSVKVRLKTVLRCFVCLVWGSFQRRQESFKQGLALLLNIHGEIDVKPENVFDSFAKYRIYNHYLCIF